MKIYDAIIIGAGQAGVPLAKKLAKAGWKTALIEKRFVGGTCVNDGCTPTKTMIASGRISYLAKNSSKWGVNIDNYSIDMSTIKKRKDDIIISSREGIEEALKEIPQLDLIYGEATFSGNKTITLKLTNGSTEEISANKIFINTGTTTAIPDIEGIHDINYLTSTTILDMDVVPKHLLILGASYIALEFGQLYRRLGSEVTLLEYGDKFLFHEDDDVASELKNIFNEDGIAIHLNAEIKGLQRLSENNLKAHLKINDKLQEINCSHLLIAAGRPPQTEALNLDKTGVKVDEKGYIQVNDKLETNIEGIYALGDAKGGPAFTHIAYNDYVVIWKNLLEKGNLSTKDRMVPYCIFTDPQLGRIGLSENEARKKGIRYKVAKISMDNVARAMSTGETRGFMKAIVDEESKQILGATVLGVEGGEIMTVLQMAMMGGVTYEQIRFGVFAHPTFSESLNNLFMTIMD